MSDEPDWDYNPVTPIPKKCILWNNILNESCDGKVKRRKCQRCGAVY